MWKHIMVDLDVTSRLKDATLRATRQSLASAVVVLGLCAAASDLTGRWSFYRL